MDPVRGYLVQRIIEYKQLHVLKWFLSAEACEIIGDTMCTLAYALVLFAVCSRVEGCNSTELVELILESNLCMNVLPTIELKSMLQALLRLAIRWDRTDLLRLAVAHGADVNAHVGDNSALYHCAVLGHVECLHKLADSGFVGVQCNFWRLITNVDTALALINMGVDTRDTSGCDSPLHIAVSRSNLKMVEALVTRGFADVNASGKDGMTPLLSIFASDSWSKSCIPTASFLIANGTDLRQRDKIGRTALHYVTRGRVEREPFAFLLTEDPELINVSGVRGRTPLHCWLVAHSRQYETEDLDALLSHGADPHIQDHLGESAYDELMKDEHGLAYVASHPDFFPAS